MTKIWGLVLLFAISLPFTAALAQQPTRATLAAAESGAVPQLITYAGLLKDSAGKPVTAPAGVTFLIYKDEQGGAPMWLETQSITPDSSGHYSAQLGATSAHGLPADIFQSGEARWLAVQIAGEAEQTRVLLVAVPYAMKAQDAQTIGGLPPSAFVLAAAATSALGASTGGSGAGAPPASSDVTTTGGTVNAIPLFTTTANIQNSIVTQTGTTAVNVVGKLNLPATGAATATAGKNSQPQNFVASSFSSSTSTAVNQTFQWQAEPAGNDTATPTGTLNLRYGLGATAPSETGLKISNKGVFTFATGQTFPGTGPGTITGVTTATGSGLSGGGTTGTLSLKLLSTCTANQILKWSGTAWACAADANSGGTITGVTAGAGLSGGGTSGAVTLKNSGILGITAGTGISSTGGQSPTLSVNSLVPLLSAANTFTNTQVINGQLAVGGLISATNSGISALQADSGNADATTVYSIAASTTGEAWGVEGVTNSSAANAYGVYGLASSTTGTPIGVYGKASAPDATSAGVFGQFGAESATGQSWSSAGLAGFGTWGDGGTGQAGVGLIGTADNGYGAIFQNNSGIFPTVSIFASSSGSIALAAGGTGACDIDSFGNLSCTGTKNAMVPVDGGARAVAMSAIESPQNWFEDFGSAELVNGAAVIQLDSTFTQTVNTAQEYFVVPVPNGDCKGLYVSNRTPSSFEVHELGGGTSNIHFSYRITAIRKNYETVRFADRTRAMQTLERERARFSQRPAHPVSHDPVMKPVAQAGRPKLQASTTQR